MARILLSIALGFFTVVVFIGVGEFVKGGGEVTEAVAGGLTVALYLMMAEFLVAPRGSRGLREKWPTMIAMGASVLVILLVLFVAGGPRVWLYDVSPLFVLGCLGILTGAAIAGRVTFRAVSPGSSRRLLLASAAVVAAVAVVEVVMIPLTVKAGTFPDGTPGAFVTVFWVFVVLNAVIAACLGYFGFRVGDENRPSFAVLGFLAFLVFMSACALVPPAFFFLGHGPVLLTVSKLALLCLVAEVVVTALVGITALRLSKAGPA